MTFAIWSDFRDLTMFAANQISIRLFSPKLEGKFASLIGDLNYTFRKSKRRSITRGLNSVFGDECSPTRAEILTREILRNTWKNRFVLSAVNRRSSRQAVEVIGLENVREALARGFGVILWEGTFGSRLLAKSVLAAEGLQLWQVYAPEHGGSTSWVGQQVIRKLYRRAVSKQYSGIIDIQRGSFGYLRKLVHVLQENNVLCISGLGDTGQKSVSVELLGTTFRLPTGAVTLARMTGAPIVPIFCFNDGNGNDRLVMDTPIRDHAGDSDQEGVAASIRQYVQLLESYIVRYPDQWYSWHSISGKGLK